MVDRSLLRSDDPGPDRPQLTKAARTGRARGVVTGDGLADTDVARLRRDQLGRVDAEDVTQRRQDRQREPLGVLVTSRWTCDAERLMPRSASSGTSSVVAYILLAAITSRSRH